MSRPTIIDLAKAAGVSPATVDRVLNGRQNVREETVRRVHEAAEAIGYHGANVIRYRLLADKPEFRLGLVLQKPRHAFYQDVLRIFEAQARACMLRRVQITARFTATAQAANISAPASRPFTPPPSRTASADSTTLRHAVARSISVLSR